MTEPIDAVPTAYSGTHVRSRLEADWARTLYGLGIVWKYEPELITLPSGIRYLPDFWLPEIGTWLEVKGPTTPRREKAAELGKARACHCASTCTCQWPGGQLVLLGWPSHRSPNRPGYRARYGHAWWESAFGPGAYLIECPQCTRAHWVTMRRPWQCRGCRASLGATPRFYSPAEQLIRFGEDDSLASALFEEDMRRLAEEQELAELGDEDGYQ
ncbi:hypothetical protein OHA84_01490 [Streptomyces sp. NBC_00513]|uniref:hypothetical protein n=1 Tax=unclassified Streptomyces TaxID=2593676 RepID=UPI00224D5BF1|nr:hypothetical protein [Streptomyces sp. NBC_00424]MCX5079161.1 hypothetical protein [Streptomyces sp. NBC_00424]WUD39276.1 hypothetical protein OHA84_01490 [Streptomyces sp. NBC_00513]